MNLTNIGFEAIEWAEYRIDLAKVITDKYEFLNFNAVYSWFYYGDGTKKLYKTPLVYLCIAAKVFNCEVTDFFKETTLKPIRKSPENHAKIVISRRKGVFVDNRIICGVREAAKYLNLPNGELSGFLNGQRIMPYELKQRGLRFATKEEMEDYYTISDGEVEAIIRSWSGDNDRQNKKKRKKGKV